MAKKTATKKKVSKAFKKVMHNFGQGKLHSGSKKGPEVEDPKQALAIAFSESREAKKKHTKPREVKKKKAK